MTLQVGDARWPRRDYIAQGDQVFRIHPAHPIEELRKSALLATPPEETGDFRKPDLVELGPPDIRLDIRYATSHDFLGTSVYSQARARFSSALPRKRFGASNESSNRSGTACSFTTRTGPGM